MKKILIFLIILSFISCSRSQSVKSDNVPFEDFMQQMEDPSINQQKQGIVKNHIKTCTITKWEHSSNDKKLTLKDEKTVIYYNDLGLIDSMISNDFRTHRIVNKYDSDGKLIQRNEYNEVDGIVRFRNENERPDNYETKYSYDEQNRLVSEVISCLKDSITITIHYVWKNFVLNSMEVRNDLKKSILIYNIHYENDKISKLHRIDKLKNTELLDITNEFIYEHGILLEVTNTWMMADGKLNNPDVTNTKFKYDKDKRIIQHQKVYGMWPGESFWVTTFRYLGNGLIEEKEMNNDGEFGKHKIIYKYTYE